MKKVLTDIQSFFKKHPLASLFFIISLFLYFYTDFIDDYLRRPQIYTVEKESGWFLATKVCDREYGYRGSDYDCYEEEVAGPFDDFFQALEEESLIKKSRKKILEQRDFLGVRFLGDFFGSSLDLIFLLIGLYVWMNKRERDRKKSNG